MSITLVMVMILFSMFQSIAIGAERQTSTTSTTSVEKAIPFPSQTQNTRMSLMNLYAGNIGNESVQAQVSSDGRFNAGLKDLSSDRWYNLIYAWPSSPGTSFTSLKVDGQDQVYGNGGEFLQFPTNDEQNTKNESVWKTGDVTVKQVIQPGLNPATGQADALQMRYIITNTSTTNHHDVGLRMMFDTMVDYNDAAPFKVPGVNGVESVNYERDYVGSEVPDFWQVFNDFNNPDISAQYTMKGGVGAQAATPPDRFTIARWGAINGTVWDYNINPGASTGDSAVGMWWNPVNLAPGQQKIITTYFGRPGVGGSEALVLSGRNRLTHEEWSTAPFNLISYFTNNTGTTLNDVRLELTADPGITLVDNDPERVLGTVQSGSTSQHTWKLQPNTHGKHKITVKAYANGLDVPFAIAEYEVEALEPVVPPNVTLGGSNGTTADGTPVAGRVSPLTINAAFDQPQAVGVTLIATDADGTEYRTEMASTDQVNWSHTFVPSQVGLWEAPLTIQIIPRYLDGTTGAPQQFEIVLIDPSGYIYNANEGDDWRLPGATVVLQYFDPSIETWVNMTEEAYPGMLSPTTNPQITNEEGRYAWDVAEGRYRVIVSRPGFETTISREVVVPPPVLDLHVGLTPTDFLAPIIQSAGAVTGDAYTEAVNIDFSATDDAAGVRTISYQVDSSNEVIMSGSNASIPSIDSIGLHTVTLKAVDYAGNVATTVITFEIKAEETEEDIIAVVTAAIEKSKDAQTRLNAAMEKINRNDARAVIKAEINAAKAANDEARVKIARLKELLNTYTSPKMPPLILTLIKRQVQTAELQANTVDAKLVTAIQQLDSNQALSMVKTQVSGAQTANKQVISALEYVKGNLIIYAP
jgi:hypothetical protein